MESYVYKAIDCNIELQSIQFFENKDEYLQDKYQKISNDILDLREQMALQKLNIEDILQDYKFDKQILLLSENKSFKKILIRLSLNQEYIFNIQQFDDYSYIISPEKNKDNDRGKFIFGKKQEKLNLKQIDEKLQIFLLDKSEQQFYTNSRRLYSVIKSDKQDFKATFTILDFIHEKNQEKYYIYLYPFIYNYSLRDITTQVEKQVSQKLESCRYLYMEWIPQVKKISFNKIQELVNKILPYFFFKNQNNKYLIIAEQEYHGKTEFLYLDDKFLIEKIQITKNKYATRLYDRNDLYDILTELQVENGNVNVDKVDQKSEQILYQIGQFVKYEHSGEFNVLVRTNKGTSIQQYLHKKFDKCKIKVLIDNEQTNKFIQDYFNPVKHDNIQLIQQDIKEFYKVNDQKYQFVIFEDLATFKNERESLNQFVSKDTQIFVQKQSEEKLDKDEFKLKKEFDDFWIIQIDKQKNNQFNQLNYLKQKSLVNNQMNSKYVLFFLIIVLQYQSSFFKVKSWENLNDKILKNSDKMQPQFKELLLSNPLQDKIQLDKAEEKQGQKQTKINKDFERFLMTSPINNQHPQNRKLSMMESKSENRKFNAQIVIENNLDSYLSQLTIDIQKSEVIEQVQESDTCSEAFLDIFRKTFNKNYAKPSDFISQAEKKSCPDIESSCCKLLQYQKFALLIIKQRKKMIENFEYLNYVIMILDSMNEDNLDILLEKDQEMTDLEVEEVIYEQQQKSSQFQNKYFMNMKQRIPECSERLSDVEILLKKYQKIRQKRYNYKQILKEYYDMVVEDYYNTLCSMCNGKNQEFFKLNLYTFKYDLIINLPNEFTRFYEKIYKIQNFLPLIAFSNIYKCLTVPNHQEYLKQQKFLQSRDIQFQYLNHEDLMDYKEWDLNQILDEADYINYFEENYSPGRYLNFSFKNVFHNLYPLLPEYKQKLIPRPQEETIDDMFGNWEDIFTIDINKNILVPDFIPEQITLKYSNLDGYWAGQNKFRTQGSKKQFLQLIENQAYSNVLYTLGILYILFNQIYQVIINKINFNYYFQYLYNHLYHSYNIFLMLH